jgi:prolyl oligopeptidase
MMKVAAASLLVFLIAAVMLVSARAADVPAKGGPPSTPRRPVVDVYFGVKVADPYRWLEDWSNPEVQAWSEGQNAYARALLARLPHLDAIRARVAELERGGSPEYGGLVQRGGVLFALKWQPPKQQPFLVTLTSPEDISSERVLLDPNVLDAQGTTRIDFYVPSRDGSKVAVSLSERGTESGTIRVIETSTRRELPDRIERVNGGTAGGSVAWNADGSGIYYTRYPHAGERPADDLEFFQQVYLHTLGAPAQTDHYELGKEFPRIAETVLATSEDGRSVLASVANGDGGEFEHFVKHAGGEWKQFTHFADGVVHAAFSADGGIYLLVRKGSPRGKIVRVALDNPRLDQATVIVPESEAVIQGFLVTPEWLCVHDLVGGPSQVRMFQGGTRAQRTLPVPANSSLGGLAKLDKDIVFRAESYLAPAAWYRYSPADGKLTRTALFKTSPADFSDCEVVRETATSKDGTKVPLTIVRRKGVRLERSNPTLLTGYGGFGISITPAFSATARIWLEQGGVFAIANTRGGGEFGGAWHEQGKTTRKQNVFDDFAACAKFLLDAGYANPRTLAIEGGSNGGLLMGAMITQHPELFRAVVAYVGLFDMLRFERFPNGQFNITEYGSVANEEQFRAIHAYSPYQHVTDGTAYPACLFLTGANDPRVDPANSRKMVARLRAASSSGRAILLRTTSSTGHIGTPLDEMIAEQADVYAFLFHELGAAYTPVATAK